MEPNRTNIEFTSEGEEFEAPFCRFSLILKSFIQFLSAGNWKKRKVIVSCTNHCVIQGSQKCDVSFALCVVVVQDVDKAVQMLNSTPKWRLFLCFVQTSCLFCKKEKKICKYCSRGGKKPFLFLHVYSLCDLNWFVLFFSEHTAILFYGQHLPSLNKTFSRLWEEIAAKW